jgi:hypothetical protein
MQKAIVFCFCLAETFFPASLSFAQNVQFRVTTDNTPMAYTYVFINQKAVGSTDTLGLFSISGAIRSVSGISGRADNRSSTTAVIATMLR